MSTNTTAPKHFSKLRGQFDSFEGANPAVNDAQKFYDKLTRRDETYLSKTATPQKWLVSKSFDLLFVCGFAPWILGTVAMFLNGGTAQKAVASPEQQVFTIFLVVASFIVGESHQFTSVIRYYSKTFRQRKNPYLWHRLPIWILYAVAAILGFAILGANVLNFAPLRQLSEIIVGLLAMPFSLLAILMLTLFPAFLMQHFCAQAKAVGITYCSNNQFHLSDLEKYALSAVSWLLVITGVLTIATPFFGNLPPMFEQFLKADAPFNPSAIVVTRYSVVFLGIHFIVRGIRNNEWLPVGAALTWLNMALFTLISTSWILYVWLFVPVFFHASQHWTIAWSVQQKEGRRQGSNNPHIELHRLASDRDADRHKFYSDFRRLVLPVQIFSVVVLFGTLIWQHLWGNPIVQGSDLTLSAVFSILVFYCHYFTDRIVWRPTN